MLRVLGDFRFLPQTKVASSSVVNLCLSKLLSALLCFEKDVCNQMNVAIEFVYVKAKSLNFLNRSKIVQFPFF